MHGYKKKEEKNFVKLRCGYEQEFFVYDVGVDKPHTCSPDFVPVFQRFEFTVTADSSADVVQQSSTIQTVGQFAIVDEYGTNGEC